MTDLPPAPSPLSTDPIVELSDLSKSYTDEGPTILSSITMNIHAGDRVSIMGPSGCGKSTLLNIIGTLDSPTSGTCLFGGQDVTTLNPAALAALRNTRVGFVFQQHHLLPHCTALENILLPVLALHRCTEEPVEERARMLLDRISLSDRMHAYPHQLSGGERQRVAVLRALINHPDLILADEPTGALDRDTALRLIDMLIELADEQQAALILVSHSAEISDRMAMRYVLEGGVLSPR